VRVSYYARQGRALYSSGVTLSLIVNGTSIGALTVRNDESAELLELATSPPTLVSVENSVTVAGEAARRVSQQVRVGHSDVLMQQANLAASWLAAKLFKGLVAAKQSAFRSECPRIQLVRVLSFRLTSPAVWFVF